QQSQGAAFTAACRRGRIGGTLRGFHAAHRGNGRHDCGSSREYARSLTHERRSLANACWFHSGDALRALRAGRWASIAPGRGRSKERMTQSKKDRYPTSTTDGPWVAIQGGYWFQRMATSRTSRAL